MTIALRPRGPFSLRPPLVVALTDDGGDAVALRAVWTGESVDPAFLRGLALDAALTHLESLPGIGPFGPCSSPPAEPATRRPPTDAPPLPQAVAAAYGLSEEPDEAKLASLSEGWRPYRAWITYLLRSADTS